MKNGILAAIMLFAAAPALAQDESQPPANASHDVEALASAFGEMFPAEPLTPEQEARLPMAQAVVAHIFPPGTYARMMEEMMGPMMDSILGSMAQIPVAQLAAIAGMEQSQVAAMGEAKLGEVMAIVDPAHERRSAVASDVMVEMLGDVMERIEPSYREGLARAYATRFDPVDLAELDRFFQTPVGSRYAAESMLIFADPQVMSAMNEAMPAVLEMMPAMMERMQQRMEDLPEPRALSDLSDAELQRLSELLGVPAEELRAKAADSETAVEGEAPGNGV
ncbi:DUF2059 domain-containing protein [Pelagerythrobacter rhizovicinus]|uniref:DUF2059 domain-containing protein n=1 Tax=Pelagerythrobacter rhizovicinus TaxID=2268576 RepID=A0A4Q2KKV8_9SPHN|nr:DUF2059 domain-containing protein [Pelagerythrobacter rhizovicinus]RXZ64840.1 DUF2059 domain-containing protein [Pelagerythrobacter rhizovicinus]